MGSIACDAPTSMGIVLTPAFCHTKGALWLAENAALKVFSLRWVLPLNSAGGTRVTKAYSLDAD